MNLELTELEKKLQETWKKFADTDLPGFSDVVEKREELPSELLNLLRERQILKPFLPKESGGDDLGLFPLTILLEEVSRFIPALGVFLAQQVILGIRASAKFLNRADRPAIGVQAANFEKIFSVAATEIGSGCDLSQIETRCRKNPDGGFRVSGAKAYVNWARKAKFIVLLAKPEESEITGSTVLFIENPSPGITIGEPHQTMGLSGLEASPLQLIDQDVPGGNLAGVYGFGGDVFEGIVNEMRLCIASIAVGLAQQAFDEAAGHAKSRRQFGKPIGSFQSLQWRFADAATKIEGARMHVWHAAEVAGQKQSCSRQAAMAKIFATEAAGWVADFAVQAMGSKGFIRGNHVERLYRDARFLKVCHGSSEILRTLISGQL